MTPKIVDGCSHVDHGSISFYTCVLVQAMGILFLVSTTALGVGLSGHGLLNTSYLLISTLAVAPAFIGMALGQRVRRSIPEKRFARIFFCSLLLLGIYIIGNCFF